MRIILIVLLICLLTLTSAAQDTPPVGHTASCEANPVLFDIFGPNCLNPVEWNLPGFYAIGTTVHFVLENGETDMGQVAGYSWQPLEGHYEYYLMTQMPYGRFGGEFKVVVPEAIIQTE